MREVSSLSTCQVGGGLQNVGTRGGVSPLHSCGTGGDEGEPGLLWASLLCSLSHGGWRPVLVLSVLNRFLECNSE